MYVASVPLYREIATPTAKTAAGAPNAQRRLARSGIAKRKTSGAKTQVGPCSFVSPLSRKITSIAASVDAPTTNRSSQ